MPARLVTALLALVLLLPAAGCWDQREVETLGLVDGLALERGTQGQIKLTLQMLNARAMLRASGGAGIQGIKAYQNFSAQGATVDDALVRLNRITPHVPFLTSVRLVVVAEDLAREQDLRQLLDFLTRNREMRRSAWFVVARSPVSRVLDINTPLTVTPSAQVEDVLLKSNVTGLIAVSRLGDVVKAVAAPGTSPAVAGVLVRPAVFEAPPDMEAHSLLPEPRWEIVVTGTAVFRDGLLVGWLDEEETNGLLWVQGKRGGVIEVPTAGGNPVTSLNLVRTRSAVRLQKVGGQPAIFVRIEATTVLAETQSPLDLSQVATYSGLEQGAAVVVEKEVRAALSQALAGYRADVFGFARVVHRADPQLWRTLEGDWANRLPQLPVSVEAVVTVRHSGLVDRPLLKLH